MEPILKTENLWKIYRTGKVDVPALRGVDIQILPGEFVSIMGPSGCGKSTMLHVIGGLAQATRGKVLLDGNDLTTMTDAARTMLRRHKVGFVFQRFNLLPTLDAYHNIVLAQHIRADGFDPHRFEVVADLLGITSRLKHKPSEMSGGEQQRVAIARAIVCEPKIVLADEPTGSLDFRTGEMIMELIEDLHRNRPLTSIHVTHNLNFARRADRVLTMERGGLAATSTSRPAASSTYSSDTLSSDSSLDTPSSGRLSSDTQGRNYV